jgi:hypothetical protein
MFLYHKQRCTTVGSTFLEKWSTCRRDLYLTTHTKLTTTNADDTGGIRSRNPRFRATTDPRLRPRGHRDRRGRLKCVYQNCSKSQWKVTLCKDESVFTDRLFATWKVSTFYYVMRFLVLRNKRLFYFEESDEIWDAVVFFKNNLGHKIKNFPQHITNICGVSRHVASSFLFFVLY